jgi:glutathione synthase/RimK-type ligase-like ATP-grasp enzyme
MSARSPRMALATCSWEPDLFDDERELLPMLRACGIDAHAVVWDDPAADWCSFDAVVIRSTWGYVDKYEDFLAWLARLERTEVAVYNSPSLVRWNADKLYLRELEGRGVRIVPTVFCERGARTGTLAEIVSAHGWKHAVLKPSVSAGAFRTHLIDGRNTASSQPDMDRILESCAALVQPFFPEIASEGEWSLFFFEGEFSHAVLKVPCTGEFRVQPYFGASFSRVHPEPRLIGDARRVLAALPEPPVYARIDGLRRGDDFYLVEAELIEPQLFLGLAKEAATKYVRALERLV